MTLRRGIFRKLATVFFLIGLVPMIGLSFFTYLQVRKRMTSSVIEYWLAREAADLTRSIDETLLRMRRDAADLVRRPDLAADLSKLGTPDFPAAAARLAGALDAVVASRDHVDLVLVLDRGLRIAARNLRDGAGRPLRPAASGLDGRDVASEADAPLAAAGLSWKRDWMASPLTALAYGRPEQIRPADGGPPAGNPAAFGVGFAEPIPGGGPGSPHRGFVYVLFNWAAIQSHLDVVESRFRAESTAGRSYASGYPFLFAGDHDTIIGHRDKRLYGTSLRTDHGLATLHEAVAEGALQHSYVYPQGVPKIAGLRRTLLRSDAGFGWTAGVGINNDEIFADVDALRNLQIAAVVILVGVILLFAALSSRRLTEPITRLIGYTRRVASGDIDARVEIRTGDEIEGLAASFNHMVEDLKRQNERLVRAEKDAAWREMARQVAHEIKNPLTPMRLMAQHLERAHADRHPDFDAILREGLRSIIAQIDSLVRIASNFSSYAAFPPRSPSRIPLNGLVATAVRLAAPAPPDTLEIVLRPGAPDTLAVLVDGDEMNRVFLNLIQNAAEAMAGRGRITVETSLPESGPDRGRVVIRVTDDGPGIPAEHRARLFQPYFSTRSGGTGLGLAICRKIVEDAGGAIAIESGPERGTSVVISLPAA